MKYKTYIIRIRECGYPHLISHYPYSMIVYIVTINDLIPLDSTDSEDRKVVRFDVVCLSLCSVQDYCRVTMHDRRKKKKEKKTEFFPEWRNSRYTDIYVREGIVRVAIGMRKRRKSARVA